MATQDSLSSSHFEFTTHIITCDFGKVGFLVNRDDEIPEDHFMIVLSSVAR